jgi:hypothetical protein
MLPVNPRQRTVRQRGLRVAGLELDAQFARGLPRGECIGEESDEFRVIATCRQFGN